MCAVGRSPEDIVDETRITTSDPASTIDSIVRFLAPHRESLTGVGVASFGPVELREGHPRLGSVTVTPKAGWSHTPIAPTIASVLDLPVGFDTDVNGAALGEGRWGAARGLDTFVYLTVGTGVGGGAVVGGAIAHGLVHPEMGHIAVRRMPGDGFEGICPFHGDCLEGMASGPAMEARWGRPAEELTGRASDDALRLEAHYLADGLRTVVYALAPQRIVVGGGVAGLPGLFDAVRASLQAALGGYPGLSEHDDPAFVSPAALAGRSGIAGGFVLAEMAAGD